MRKKRQRTLGAAVLLMTAAAVVIAFLLPKLVQKLLYPVAYESEIRQAADTYALPPALIAAVVRTESGYDRFAESRVGAKGLMQIMPSTGEWIHKKLHADGNFSTEILYVADVSLNYGCWYMRFLIDRYAGNLVSALAAYHTGQGTVDEWLKDERYSSGGAALSAFPDGAGATEHYVQKVLKAYEYYSKVYEGK